MQRHALKRKKVLVLGDKFLSLIGIASGADSYTVEPNVCKLPFDLSRRISEYGVVIVLESIYRQCKGIRDVLDSAYEDTLVVVIPSPKEIRGIDYRKYYEEFVGKTIGLKISF